MGGMVKGFWRVEGTEKTKNLNFFQQLGVIVGIRRGAAAK
jgi:hypothetical protein